MAAANRAIGLRSNYFGGSILSVLPSWKGRKCLALDSLPSHVPLSMLGAMAPPGCRLSMRQCWSFAIRVGFQSRPAECGQLLVNDLKVDWRLGALWFEHCLIDYDVASNWGNWRYIAGIGRDPRQDRYFNVLKQASHYDPKGALCSSLAEAARQSSYGSKRHQPWRAYPLAFEAPCVEPKQWERWLIPL